MFFETVFSFLHQVDLGPLLREIPAMSVMRKFDRNKLAVGLFGSNCDGGQRVRHFRSGGTCRGKLSRAGGPRRMPDRFYAAPRPLDRLRRRDQSQRFQFRDYCWASGLLAATKNIMAFGTVHVTAHSPAVAAKQMAGDSGPHRRRRFGLNIVCGWYKEFDMLGVDLGEHERRYDLGQEWIDLVTQIWT